MAKLFLQHLVLKRLHLQKEDTLLAQRIVDWLSIPVSVEDPNEDMLPASFSLKQNYPNPFNPVTTIEYQISLSTNISIKVYDVIGREIAVLVNEVKQPGVYQVSFDSEDLASGVCY